MISSSLDIFPDYARYWARQLGVNESSLIRLKGGINNKVFRCGDSPFWVIKGYSQSLDHDFDKFKAEINFLNYSIVSEQSTLQKSFILIL